ncbi:MAG: hypothetical protein ACFFER_09150 [Candidatus Thorarchaeota archaeon]
MSILQLIPTHSDRLPSSVGTKVMPFPDSVEVVIEMAYTTKQQTISEAESLEFFECDEATSSEQIVQADEKAREIRKHLAQEKALRELERRKSDALAALHRMSLIR